MNFRTSSAICLLLAGVGLLAVNAVFAMSNEPESPPEEIIVHGQRTNTLPNLIIQAEDVFFGLFNELNSDDLYDIRCVSRAPLGTRFLARTCYPNFYARTTEEFGQNYLRLIRGENGGTVLPNNGQLAFHYPILEQKMKELVEQDPQLRDAIMRVNELRAELEAQSNSSELEND